jgi:transcription elongation factor GreA
MDYGERTRRPPTKLVTSEETDVANGRISTSSPIGRSLIGKREGDVVKVRVPDGVIGVGNSRLTTIHDEVS